MAATQVARTFNATPHRGGSPKVRLASGGSHGHNDVMDAYFYQCAHCGNSYPFIAALQQPIRLAISLRQPAPVSFFRKETGAEITAAALAGQHIAAFVPVTIGVTNPDVTRSSNADDGAAVHGMDCT
ncbi:hypothetical protein [Pseudomonas helleri]|uniref:hypothetical protein n=1 Tax=Pseudomonas helleri TaxID=1608996 RepID=UPI003FD37664